MPFLVLLSWALWLEWFQKQDERRLVRDVEVFLSVHK